MRAAASGKLPEPRTDTPARLPQVVVSNYRPAAGDEVVYTTQPAHDQFWSARPSPGGDDLTVRGVGRPLLASNPPESMVATTLRVAAIRNMALEPQRKAEIAARVATIKTGEEAVAYIKEVEAKLKAAGKSLK